LLTKAHSLRTDSITAALTSPHQPVPVCNEILNCRVGADVADHCDGLDHRDFTRTPRLALCGILGTKLKQDRQHQPNAATISENQASIVTGLKSKTLSIAATCFRYPVHGRYYYYGGDDFIESLVEQAERETVSELTEAPYPRFLGSRKERPR
jgi:hypothetical protein